MTRPIEQRVLERLLDNLQRIRRDLSLLKKTCDGSVSLRCQSLNDQCDLLEEILGIPRSFPRAQQADR